jgi:hypothetical protein
LRLGELFFALLVDDFLRLGELFFALLVDDFLRLGELFCVGDFCVGDFCVGDFCVGDFCVGDSFSGTVFISIGVYLDGESYSSISISKSILLGSETLGIGVVGTLDDFGELIFVSTFSFVRSSLSLLTFSFKCFCILNFSSSESLSESLSESSKGALDDVLMGDVGFLTGVTSDSGSKSISDKSRSEKLSIGVVIVFYK